MAAKEQGRAPPCGWAVHAAAGLSQKPLAVHVTHSDAAGSIRRMEWKEMGEGVRCFKQHVLHITPWHGGRMYVLVCASFYVQYVCVCMFLCGCVSLSVFLCV